MPTPDVTDFRRWMGAQGLTANTIKQRVMFAERMLRQWGTFDVEPHELAEWLSGFHGWTRVTYLNHLRAIYSWLTDTSEISASPIERFRRPPQPRPRPKPLSAVELDRAMSSAQGHLRTWMALAFFAGLRCHEIAKIRGEDIDETMLVVLGKGGESAMLPTHPMLWRIAQEYPRHGYWFPSPHGKRQHISESQIGTKVRAHFRQVGIETGSIHRLRHSYGTSLSRNGVSTRVLQDLMRHRSLETTQLYVDVVHEDKMKAIRTLSAALPAGEGTAA